MIYDCIVVGGGTAGCAAAYNLGMAGLKTLLIEKNIHLGGTITSGLVVPAMKSAENQINTRFFDDLIEELSTLNAQTTYIDGNKGWFNHELTKIALDRLLVKAGVDIRFSTTVTDITTDNSNINGITISCNMLSEYIEARYVIDATGNCDVGMLAKCEFLNKNNEQQPTTLRFTMSGINLKRFSKWLLDFDTDRKITTVATLDGEIHLSTAYTWDSGSKWALSPLFEDAVAKGILKNTDRNYFQVFSIPNMPTSLTFNCPRIHFDNNINPLDPIMLSKALLKGRDAIIRLADFCKQYFPGFKNAYISNIADMLGVRVSRRIHGKYVYTSDDLKTGKKFDTPVLISNYPIDIHSTKNGESVLEHTSQEYQLPIEALMSKDFDNLFVAGRCLSADFEAQAALRIQPSCFSMGEGVAKYIKKLIQ